LSIKRRNSTRSNSSLFVFVIRKTLNQRSLWFRAMTQSLGHRIAWYPCAENLPFTGIAVTNLKFLVGMLDEDRRDYAKGGLASDRQPSCGCCGSRRGRASRRRIVHRSSAGQLRSSIFDSHSTPADSIRHLSHFVLGITGLIFLVVFSLLSYVVVNSVGEMGSQSAASCSVEHCAGCALVHLSYGFHNDIAQ